jgi:hypothetical protein
MAADLANKPLRHHRAQRGRHQERLHPDIDQAGHRARCIVGVQRGKHHVARERGVDRDLGRFQVADFTHHHNVRRLPQHRAQGGGKRHADVVPHRDLVDAVELVLNGVFDRDDFPVGLVDEVEAAVKRGRLAGAGWASH